ncbi:MAG: amino acid adenylation domain-containing protein [Leptolyngbyaceae cyanobacterium MO_188.B28]|nr:amino acid adenylation domain-containing protein [Leptolyngbyaceae cyanobacterium MO_188.B28]
MTDLANRLANLSPAKRALLEKRLKQKQAVVETAAIPAAFVHHQFEAQVALTPDAIAVEHDGQSLSYQQLNRRANQLARYLQILGAGPETLVGLHVERSLEMVVGLFGILKAGAAYVPLDPKYPSERLIYMATDAQLSILVTQQRLAVNLPTQATKMVRLDADWEKIDQMRIDNLDSGVKPENLAYVIYTSGSTGKPKGVMIEHQSLTSFTTAAITGYEITQRDRVLQFASISFDAAVEEIYPCLTSGGTLVLFPTETLGSVSRFLKQCWEWRLTVLDLPTAYWRQLTTEFATANLGFPDSLRLVIIGGEQAPPEQASLWQKNVGNYPRLINTYGPTEATVVATLYKLPENSSPETGLKKVPIGKGFPHVQTCILDQHQQLVPVGVPGELHIGGVSLARGYLNRPELTGQKFIPNPFSSEPGARLYKTGDLVRYLPDGDIEFLGRIDHQVKIRGFRVELGEIEAVLARHPNVQETVVIAREDSSGNKYLAAYVVLHQTVDTAANELRRFLKQQLPEYMIPQYFVALTAMPLTPSGKIDRQALPEPDKSQRSLETNFVEPRTPTEQQVAAIWTEILGTNVGLHDNFFELGGHSLLATQLITRVREAFYVDFPLRRLFESPTVAGVSELIEAARDDQQGHIAPPIQAINRNGPLPLSFAQQRLWFLNQLQEGDSSYNMTAAARLTGNLDVATLEKAVQEIVQRHEVLRTRFPIVDGIPCQVIDPNLKVTLPVINLQDLPEAEQTAQLQQSIIREAQHPFDLANAPLLRFTLFRLGDQSHRLIINLLHIISDAWSVGVCFREMATLYTAISQGELSPLPDLSIQYADFAHWQRQWLQGEILETQLNYWKQHLADAPPLLELPTDRPRPAVQSYRGAVECFSLDADLTAQLKQLGQRTGATLFMTLLAAFVVLLYRYSGQEDIVVGSPIANRNRPEIEPLIGFFLNTLALRTRLQDNPTFVDLLSQVRQIALDAYAHQDLPFEKLVEELQPQRSLSYSPLFQVMFVLQNTPRETLELPGLSLTRISERESVAARFDLTLFISESDSGLTGMWRYNTDLFDAATIGRMSDHFQTLLTAILANPQQHVGELPLLQSAEHRQLLKAWNNTHTDFPPVACLQQLFQAQVEQTPEAAAVVFEDQHLTYAELNHRANQLAHHLQSLGVGPESRVGLYVERSLEMLVGLWGILKAGGAYVPLDPTHPRQRVTGLIEDAQVSVLLTQQRFMERLSDSRVQVVCLDADWPLIAQQRWDNPQSALRPDNLAYVIYTSGSTGQPKGVAIEHRSIVNYVQGILQRISPAASRHWALVSTLAADLGNTVLFPALCTGGCLHVLSQERVTDPDAFVDYCEQRPIDILKITPSHLAALQSGRRPAEVMPQRQLILGGEAASCEWVTGLQALAPECEILNHYGPTEATVGVLTYPVQGQLPANGVTPLGRPLANTEIYILDRYLQPVPVGAPGELHIGGVSLARGYLNQPELTAERFIPNPFSDQSDARLYKSGDIARYRADGNIEFLGRIDHQVKIRGFRIELGEVEAVLGQHPQVQQGVVIAIEDGAGDQRLVAYAATADATATPSELRRFLRERLPEYMTPSTFVLLDALPLTSNGKVDRQALPSPDAAEQGSTETYIPPRTATEEALAEIWANLLRLKQVGVQDNFFELGGDSILGIQIIARARQAGLKLTPKQLFENQTIAKLAAVTSPIQMIQAEQGLVTGPVPLTPIQYWFFEQEAPEPHYYNQSVLLSVPADIDAEKLRKVMQQLLEHHDALRLRFKAEEPDWRQVNENLEETVAFSVVELMDIPAGEQSAVIEEKAAQMQQRLDLSEGPLLRAVLFRLGSDQPQRLLMVIHHLAVDGVSWRILLSDLVTAYQQLDLGQTIQLPPKSTSFKTWAERLRVHAQSLEVTAEFDYWLQQTRADVTGLPVDFALTPHANTNASTARVTRMLTVEQTQALLQEVPKAYNTQINDVLLTALAQSFMPWTGQSTLRLDLEGHGREDLFEDIDLSRTVGWFTNIFPVCLQLDQSSHPGEALKVIKEQLRKIPNRGFGYGLLRYLHEDESLRRQLSDPSGSQVRFNYLGQFHQMTTDANWLERAPESTGPNRSPLRDRGYLLDILAAVGEEQLQITWTYSEKSHQHATVEQLAQRYLDQLIGLIDHCLSPEAGGSTPSDFPEADLSQQELDELMVELEDM